MSDLLEALDAASPREETVAPKKEKRKKKKPRVWEIDFLRGVCMLFMIADHGMLLIEACFPHFTGGFLGRLFTLSHRWANNDFRNGVRPYILFAFFFLSGLSCAFTKKPFISTLKLCVAAILFSCGTALVEWFLDYKFGFKYKITTHFGVLECFALTRLCYCAFFYLNKLIRKHLIGNKRNKELYSLMLTALGYVIGTALCIVIMNYADYFAANKIDGGMNWLLIWAVPPYHDYIYETFDYFSMFPYAAYFILGIMASKLIYPRVRSLLPLRRDKIFGRVILGIISPVTGLGRYSLFAYILHIPVIFALLCLLGIIFGFGTPVF